MSEATAHLAGSSAPLELPGAAQPASPLALFSCVSVVAAAPPHGAPAPKGGGVRCAEPLSDVAAFVGASSWALAWRPRRSGGGGSGGCEWLAVGTHAASSPATRLGAPAPGPGAVQLWRVPSDASDAAGSGDDDDADEAASPPPAKKPRGGRAKAAQPLASAPAADDAASSALPSLALLLCHTRGCVWDLKWHVPPHSQQPASPSLGLLAAAFGDGTVAVFTPKPPARGGGGGGGARCYRLAPSFVGSVAPGGAGVATSVAWSGPRLAAATTDGRVLVWDLSGAEPANCSSSVVPPQPAHLQLFTGTARPLRSVCWCPPDASSADGSSSLVASVGHDGVLFVWDALGGGASAGAPAELPGMPSWRGRGASSFATCVAWARTGFGGAAVAATSLLCATEIGKLIVHPTSSHGGATHAAAKGLQSHVFRMSRTASCVWCVSHLERSSAAAGGSGAAAAMCGADGELWVATRVGGATQRMRRALIASLTGKPDKARAPKPAALKAPSKKGARAKGARGGDEEGTEEETDSDDSDDDDVEEEEEGGSSGSSSSGSGSESDSDSGSGSGSDSDSDAVADVAAKAAPRPPSGVKGAPKPPAGGAPAGALRLGCTSGGATDGPFPEHQSKEEAAAAARAAVAASRQQALHACAWGGREGARAGGEGPRAWLAVVGAAGVLRILRVHLETGA